MLIAQITDLHIGVGKDIGAKDNEKRLKLVFQALRKIRPQPDLIIATGDLTETGSVEAYRKLKKMFASFPMKIWPVMGNHDNRENFTKVFSDAFFEDGFMQYVLESDDSRVIISDTLEPGKHGGGFCENRAAWLEKQLKENTDKPVLLAIHHPPLFTGIDWMTAHNDEAWVQLLRQTVEPHNHVKKIICGHIHRPISTQFMRTGITVSAAVAAQIGLDLSPIDPDKPDGRPLVVDEPPGFALHMWNNGQFLSHFCIAGKYKVILPYGKPMTKAMRNVFHVRPR